MRQSTSDRNPLHQQVYRKMTTQEPDLTINSHGKRSNGARQRQMRHAADMRTPITRPIYSTRVLEITTFPRPAYRKNLITLSPSQNSFTNRNHALSCGSSTARPGRAVCAVMRSAPREPSSSAAMEHLTGLWLRTRRAKNLRLAADKIRWASGHPCEQLGSPPLKVAGTLPA
jgi:hypothetical protein